MKNTLRITFVFCFFLICTIVSAQVTYTGKASYYSDKLHGKKTASGVPYNQKKLTAAHRTLPFGTKVKVTNLRNNKSVVVTINDRGPYSKNRIIDLSKAAAKKIDLIDEGVSKVILEVLHK